MALDTIGGHVVATGVPAHLDPCATSPTKNTTAQSLPTDTLRQPTLP